jgi:HD-GYP domain-containing protein (c-di-GMP phosphodiesterase class II)
MPNAPPSGTVNPHYLNHVMAAGESHRVSASKDILSHSGIKLLAKGATIDARVRERLLEHKLHRPLEECVQVVPGVIPERFAPIAEAMLDEHALLRSLCRSERAQPVAASLASLPLTLPVQSLLTVYAEFQGDRLQHAVGVAMLAIALARKLLPGDIGRHRVLALAGLVHDVGELYIDPAYLRRGTPLGPEQWKHIATHPLVGHRVLRDLDGAGRPVAEAVLHHHERLDGFGYPHGLRGNQLPLDGQIIGVAEWLMALAESKSTPLTSASMAAKLIPGEFDPAILEVLAGAARLNDEIVTAMGLPLPLDQALPRVLSIAGTLSRFHRLRPWIEVQIEQARPPLKDLLEIGQQRMLRIQTAFSSTGLDAYSPELLLNELAALEDPAVHVEVMAVIQELDWRLRELEREQLLRASLLGTDEQAVIRQLIDRLTSENTAPVAPT